MKKLFVLCCTLLLLAGCGQKEELVENKETKGESAMNEQFIGKWEGNIETPNGQLPIIVDLQKNSGTLSVPAQGLSNFPLQSVKYTGDQVTVSIHLNGSIIAINGTFKNEQIEATFQQNGGNFPLILQAYKEEPVTYETLKIPVQQGDLIVALQKVNTTSPSPVAVIIAGSGPTDKDGNSVLAGKNNSLKMIAEGLAQKGITTVRYDKRGIGDNQALLTKEADVTFDHFVEDAVQIIQSLQANKAYTSVHVIGHSEGSLIGLLAAQKTGVASFVSIAGAGRPMDEVLVEQLKSQLAPNLFKESKDILAALKQGTQVEHISPELQAVFRPSVQPFLISVLKYNPATELGKVKSPVLLVQGTTDLQVKEVDAEALKKGNPDAKLLYMEGMNHVLKKAPEDYAANLATYADPTLPLHEDLLPAIQQFINGK
ncbi:alpha/beta fold hydrolase [Lysinibacillus fusiformis]|uniref:alpha/beta hydrolase n=1 Tax=Lysinibacillus fusiformis TaxID=28031 RepID=UPI001E34EB06|nr:alpha/beta fold hydrolase [Lysinibacillus fusiformis]MCE4044236.1 alpha/beta fold hydrolase [Lysinibacillus fusiformis]